MVRMDMEEVWVGMYGKKRKYWGKVGSFRIEGEGDAQYNLVMVK